MTPWYSPVQLSSGDAARDFQDRVGRFALALLVIAGVMSVASFGTHFLTHHDVEERGGLGHELVHVASLLPALAAWLLCQGKTFGTRWAEAIEAGLTIFSSALFALLGFSATTSLSVAFSVVLALTYALIARSILVLSSLQRTLWISAVSAAPTMAYFAAQGVSGALQHSVESGRVFSAFGTLWCVFAVVAAAVNSRQLYGLRAQIRAIGKLGQYTLEEKIGEGGMGVVYRATHAMLRRPAAIKLLSKELASEREHARFEREVQLTSHLLHPNTVSIFDYGRTAEGISYYVMEYLDGLDLERLVKREGPIDPARTIRILVQACGALAEAHALGLIHRDIKPANIVLTARVDEPDVVKVVDFGLAKALERDGAESREGIIAGTPMYLSPEAIEKPDTVDARSDIYALGAVAYYLLTGHDVFEADTVVGILGKHLLEEARPPSERLGKPLPADLERIVLSCLAKNREARPASAALLLTALSACDGAARYDRAAGLEWWKRRREAPRDAAAGSIEGAAATMAIDLRGRNPAVPAPS